MLGVAISSSKIECSSSLTFFVCDLTTYAYAINSDVSNCVDALLKVLCSSLLSPDFFEALP